MSKACAFADNFKDCAALMEHRLEDYVPFFELLEAFTDALLLRSSGRPGPPCLQSFWKIPWLEADDTHNALTQVVSAEFCELVVGYAVFTEETRVGLAVKGSSGDGSRPFPKGFRLDAQSSNT